MSDATVRIIGVGSPYGEDWLGWELAERLRDSPALAAWSDRVRVSLHDRPGAALVQAWAGAGLVVVLDAVRSGAAPGTVHRFDAAALGAAPRALSTHGFGVADAVRLAAALDALPGQWRFYGIEADTASTGAGLSEAVHAAIPALVSEIEAAVAAYLTGGA